MPSSTPFFFFLFCNVLLLCSVLYVDGVLKSRDDFPPGFVFGAGSSAYQIEGAAAEDGRKPSIWDTYSHSGKTKGNSTGDVSADQYHKYKEDVKLMHEMGLDAYRFSISWTRLIPDARGAFNPKGLNYYNNLIDELVSYGIQPHVTLSQFDLPQSLQDEYEGYLSPKFIEDFAAYADICFKEFGDRVKNWITFCEPNIQTVSGNDLGISPPNRCSHPFGENCLKGDSTTEPYLGAHNILLSHAAAARIYREKYQDKQRGQIGITLLGFWAEPLSNLSQDIAATERALEFQLGWFLGPLVHGDYPPVMRKIVGSRLPFFTKNESSQLKGSYDFFGFNHYAVLYVKDLNGTLNEYGSDYVHDISAAGSFSQSLITKNSSLPPDSWGLQKLLEYVKVKYNNPAVVIHENGCASTGDDDMSDPGRIEYLKSYIESVLLSIRNGSNARGYFVWSLMDSFEFEAGYTSHFGLYAVGFNDKDRKRYPRMSAKWYSSFLGKGGKMAETSSYLFSE